MNWQQSKTLQCDLILRVDFIVTVTIFFLVALEGLVANKKTIMLKKLGNH